ncbi:MAG: hypothetical protein GXP10_01695 [Gammaproteobacteria bacterium]|nr:hypothetical protein [Gammaproteobacteria bacterium]
MSIYSLDKLIGEARRLASDYRKATGKSLGGVSGEVAQYDAAKLLDLELCPEQSVGYDAIGRGLREGRRIQIKGRAIFDESKASRQRVGQLKVDQQWDSVVLVMMDEHFETTEIYEAHREQLLDAMVDSSAKRSKRGALSVAKFKVIAQLVWSREDGLLDDGVWDNQVNR